MTRPIKFYLFYILLIPAIVIAGDQLFKLLIPTFISMRSLGPVVFGEIHNAGFMMGGLSTLTPALRIVCASTFLGFAFFIFVLVQYLLTPDVKVLRIGLSFIIGGVTGNVIDRAFFGYVRDFISVLQGVYFNIADIFLGVGVALSIYSFFAFREVLWRPDCVRKGILVDPRLQLAFSFKLTLITFAFCVVLSGFSLAFMNSVGISMELMRIYVLSLGALSGLFLLATFVAGIFLSHRSIGPLYAFEKFIDGLIDGTNKAPFRLREGDNYKHLEQIAEKLRSRIK